MNKLFNQIFEGFNKSQELAREVNEEAEKELNKIRIEEGLDHKGGEVTCCNVEITQEIKDNNICPKCGEHL